MDNPFKGDCVEEGRRSKRPLEPADESLNRIRRRSANYTVYTYHPGHNDGKRLPNLTCRGCEISFRQKSVLDYDLYDEWIPQLHVSGPGVEFVCAGLKYADLQFHQYGDLCLWCRAPFPGEGHFENRHVLDGTKEGTTLNPISEFFPEVLGVPVLQDIVYEYYKPQVLPTYPHLENDNLHTDLVDLYKEGLTHMTIPGVEHVYWRHGKNEYNLIVDVPQLVDIKLDYRYFRPKQCKCTKSPCECICFAAQVKNITEVLKLTTHEYKVLGTLTFPRETMHSHDFNEDKRLSFFVYLRDLDIDLHITESWSPFYPFGKWKNMLQGPPEGMCRSEWIKPGVQVTHHTPACKRRNEMYKYESYQCMMKEGRCGRCADCVEAKTKNR
jgi:hypothetical protein